MRKNNKIYRTDSCSYRVDGMQVYLPTPSVYMNPFERLSACCFERRSTLYFNNSVHFPFENIMSAFRIIYPNKNLVLLSLIFTLN